MVVENEEERFSAKEPMTRKEKLIRIRRGRGGGGGGGGDEWIEEKRARLYSIGNEKGLTIHGTSFSSPHAISIELPYD